MDIAFRHYLQTMGPSLLRLRWSLDKPSHGPHSWSPHHLVLRSLIHPFLRSTPSLLVKSRSGAIISHRASEVCYDDYCVDFGHRKDTNGKSLTLKAESAYP